MTIETFNYLEAAFWFVVGAGMLIAATVRRKDSNWLILLVIAAVAFCMFGISDIIEARTGAWWRPAGLLVLKLFCISTFIYCYFRGKKLSTRNT